MIQITVDGRSASVENKELLTSGSVGIECQWTFSEDWAGLTKTAVFRFGEDGENREVVLTSTGGCIVPWEVLQDEGEPVFAGVYGMNQQGTIVMPTVWASIGVVKPGVDTDTPATPAPTPDVVNQIKTIANDALETAQQAMSYAEGEVDSARQYVEQAQAYAGQASGSADVASAAASTASSAEEVATSQAAVASVKADEAAGNAELAGASATSASASATAAETSMMNASLYASSASDYATQARNYEMSAMNYAGAASTSASNADSAARAARSSETFASASANTATAKAGEAAASATAAGNAQTAAETAQTAAETAQSAAESAQTAAEEAAESIEESAAQISQNTQDISDVKNAIGELNRHLSDTKNAINDPVTGLDGKAPVIIDTASGAIASFLDGADGMPVKKLTVNIEPVQPGSGDPSPDNVRPISGWTGAKVANISDSEKQPYFAGLLNGTYGFVDLGTLDWEYDGDEIFRNALRTAKFIGLGICSKYQVIQSASWTQVGDKQMSVTNSQNNPLLRIHDSSMGTDAAFFKAAMSGVYFIYELVTPATPTITPAQYNQLLASFNLGGWLTPISWQSEAGTVYGGTLTINDDGTGELRTRPEIASYNGETLIGPWVSSMDVYSSGLSPTIGAQVVDLGGAETVYQLSNEQVIDTLYGTNNIWADCGDVEVEYRADTKLYIQKINAPADDDMTADAQIASGKYFIIGGNLYLSTTTIPAGDTIIPGTNCTKTNLAEALNALNS